jgi:hypothetical protein
MLTTSHIIYRQIFDLNQIKIQSPKKYYEAPNFDLNQIKIQSPKKYSPHCNFDLNQIKIVSI